MQIIKKGQKPGIVEKYKKCHNCKTLFTYTDDDMDTFGHDPLEWITGVQCPVCETVLQCSIFDRKVTKKKRPMTNAEKIKNMSDKELGEFLKNVEKGEENISCYGCMNWGTHHSNPLEKDLYECKGCYWEGIGEDIEKWLNKEAQTE